MSDRRFNSELLAMARGASGRTQSRLADDLKVHQGKVSRWEDGLSSPTDEEVAEIARVLCVPKKFFYESDSELGAEVSFMYHRKRRKVKLSDLHRMHCQINILRIGLSRLLRPLSHFPVDVPQLPFEEYGDSMKVTAAFRAACKISGTSRISNLIHLMESLGIIVMRIPFTTNCIDAIHMWPWNMPPLVFLNESCPADRERFSLAHELGHIVMHRIPTPEMEEEADSFARELLLPREGFRSDVNSSLTLNEAFRLKYKWRVSGQAIIYQAKAIGAITARKYESLCKYLSKLGYRKNEPNPISREHGTTVRRLLELYRTKLDYRDADLAETVFLSEADFRRYYDQDTFQSGLRVYGESFGSEKYRSGEWASEML